MPEAKKFRKKPVVIEAVQVRQVHLSSEDASVGVLVYDGSPFSCRCDWINDAIHNGILRAMASSPADFVKWSVRTLEGVMVASPDDWIIKGVNGELYPCKPDIFEKTYEEVVDA